LTLTAQCKASKGRAT